MKEQNESACPFTIEVLGEGLATAKPDETRVTLGVISEGEKLEELQAGNAAKIAAIVQALTALGVARENIATASFAIEPQYDYVDGKQVFRGYKATHLLQVTIAGTEAAGRIIDAAVANGANTVTDVSFRSSMADEAQHDALTLAVRNAQAKALAIADTLGVSLSAVPCKVEETQKTGFEPVQFKAAMPVGDAATTLEPGTLTFRAAVRVWYLYA
ncbi:SIMPL domain-containing protein [Paenibacillus sp. LHD-117]|uniref:SIMPL domain-containing protein n=1 Tax=Paenibacillus sp. LHD-117 TaxID=3071412 RepID=UPI0027DEB2C7|nr:SIMPL domain-containing protein [Paenibacillus sp. LHD-117]MDQ6419756.1 SIMPL domain-containing protein [Paenibacillus sp. LHD-117]